MATTMTTPVTPPACCLNDIMTSSRKADFARAIYECENYLHDLGQSIVHDINIGRRRDKNGLMTFEVHVKLLSALDASNTGYLRHLIDDIMYLATATGYPAASAHVVDVHTNRSIILASRPAGEKLA